MSYPEMKLGVRIWTAFAIAEAEHGRIVRNAEPNWDAREGLQLLLADEVAFQQPMAQPGKSVPKVKFDALQVATQMARDRATVGLR